ncbi:hypothetical protein [Pseudomonas sp. UM16]|uniref:hypothetical protein n=1 Tax=Pseudomonas sp. UM16 TaxID=3158962 RepID=UPI00398FA5F2
MNRSLLLLNALALAVLVGLIMQPEGSVAVFQGNVAPLMPAQRAVFDAQAKTPPAATQPAMLSPRPRQERLMF